MLTDRSAVTSSLSLGIALALFVAGISAVFLTLREAPEPEIVADPVPVSADRLLEIFLGRAAPAYYLSPTPSGAATRDELKLGEGNTVKGAATQYWDSNLAYCDVADALAFETSTCDPTAGAHGFRIAILEEGADAAIWEFGSPVQSRSTVASTFVQYDDGSPRIVRFAVWSW